MKFNKLDAVISASDSHRVILENEKVRVLEVIIEPGKKEPEHIHELFSVMTVTSSAKIRYYKSDGSFFDIEHQNSKTEWMEPESIHSVENIDTKTYRALRVELKK